MSSCIYFSGIDQTFTLTETVECWQREDIDMLLALKINQKDNEDKMIIITGNKVCLQI